MKKSVFGRKFKRDINERKALFKTLMSSLILNERIKTTESKAKAIKPEIEKLVTKAKKNEAGARLVLEKSLSRPAMDKILKDIAPRFTTRQGGYVRIIKTGRRFGDDAKAVVIEWTEKAKEVAVLPKEEKAPKKETKKEVKKPVKKAAAKTTKKVARKAAKK